MGSILTNIEDNLINGDKYIIERTCNEVRKWFNSTVGSLSPSSSRALRLSTISYNKDYDTFDIVFHDEIKSMHFWVIDPVEPIRNNDPTTILPYKNIRFVFDGSFYAPETIEAEVFCWGEGSATRTGWGRMKFNNAIMVFKNSNCKIKLL